MSEAYRAILRDLSRYFDTEKSGSVPYRRDGYSLEPLRAYLESRGASRPAHIVAHVGGTKGKGSVTTMLSALLQAHGFSVGSYLSPHLVSYRERIRLNGRAIDADSFATVVGRVLAEKPDPGGSPMRSIFEVLTAAAALHFTRCALDAVVFEVGLGGRLDATNVLDTTVSVLTPISLDHTEVLGNTVQEIAADKAGILRSGRSAVIGPQTPEVLEVLLERCRERGSIPVVHGRDFKLVRQGAGGEVVFADGLRIGGILPAMQGQFQLDNAAVALAALRTIVGEPDLDRSREAIATARIAGRVQEIELEDGGLVVLDGAHNPFAARVLATEAENRYGKPLAVLLSLATNKDARGIIEALLPLADPMILCSFGGPRATEPAALRSIVQELGGPAPKLFADVASAWQEWLALRAERPILLVTGSLFLVGAMLRVLHAEGRVKLDPEPDPD